MAFILPQLIAHVGSVILMLEIARGGGHELGMTKAFLLLQVLPTGQQAAYNVVPPAHTAPEYTKGEPVPTSVPPIGAVHHSIVLLFPHPPFKVSLNVKIGLQVFKGGVAVGIGLKSVLVKGTMLIEKTISLRALIF